MPRLAKGRLQAGAFMPDGGIVTGSSGAATLNKAAGVVTTESLTTAAGATFTETLTNSFVKADSVVVASVTTTGTGEPVISKVTPAAGSVVIVVRNNHAATAFNAALKIAFVVFPQS